MVASVEGNNYQERVRHLFKLHSGGKNLSIPNDIKAVQDKISAAYKSIFDEAITDIEAKNDALNGNAKWAKLKQDIHAELKSFAESEVKALTDAYEGASDKSKHMESSTWHLFRQGTGSERHVAAARAFRQIKQFRSNLKGRLKQELQKLKTEVGKISGTESKPADVNLNVYNYVSQLELKLKEGVQRPLDLDALADGAKKEDGEARTRMSIEAAYNLYRDDWRWYNPYSWYNRASINFIPDPEYPNDLKNFRENLNSVAIGGALDLDDSFIVPRGTYSLSPSWLEQICSNLQENLIDPLTGGLISGVAEVFENLGFSGTVEEFNKIRALEDSSIVLSGDLPEQGVLELNNPPSGRGPEVHLWARMVVDLCNKLTKHHNEFKPIDLNQVSDPVARTTLAISLMEAGYPVCFGSSKLEDMEKSSQYKACCTDKTPPSFWAHKNFCGKTVIDFGARLVDKFSGGALGVICNFVNKLFRDNNGKQFNELWKKNRKLLKNLEKENDLDKPEEPKGKAARFISV